MTSALEIDTPAELLDVAESLARGYSGTATATASELRRGISTAYYATFSALVARASDVMLPKGSAEESATLSRLPSHRAIVRVSAWIEDKRVSQQPEHVRAAISPLIERASSQPAVLKAAGDYSVLYKSRMAADYDRLAVPNLALAEEQCRNARSIVEVIQSVDPAISAAVDAWCRAVWLSR